MIRAMGFFAPGDAYSLRAKSAYGGTYSEAVERCSRCGKVVDTSTYRQEKVQKYFCSVVQYTSDHAKHGRLVHGCHETVPAVHIQYSAAYDATWKRRSAATVDPSMFTRLFD